jgi:hypothetical protein
LYSGEPKSGESTSWGSPDGGFHVNVACADLEELRRQHPEVFARPYGKATGLVREAIPASGER